VDIRPVDIRPVDIRRVMTEAREVSPKAAGRLLTAAGSTETIWQVAEETPVAILLNGENFAVMMMTPADIEDFAIGFAITEGIVRSAADIESLRIGEAVDGLLVNLKVPPAQAAAVEDRRRTMAGRAGCGICGAQTIAAVLPRLPNVAGQVPGFEALTKAYATLGPSQTMKLANHTTHVAAFCRLDGTLDLVREDIGRHNALDKLAGALARDGRDAADGFVLLSSRISVEMVQKAAAIGSPSLAAVSAPSALALRQAEEAGIVVFGMTADGVMAFTPGKTSL
jgi:FdhD protein